MDIRAYAAYKAKENLKLFSYIPSSLGIFDVLVKITHCGICHSDIHLIDNDWGISHFPLVPGHEIVGKVVETGSNVKKLQVGDRVGIGWQSGSCHECDFCESGFENLCFSQQATAVGHYGGFAEYVICDSRFAFRLPEELDSENAAPLLCGGVTVYSPMKYFNLLPHHKVGVIGIGGLGHLAVQFAAKMGCEVTAFSTSPDKKDESFSFGASSFINSKDTIQMNKMTESLDFIISTVTAPLDWISYLKIVKPFGRLVFVGATVGEMSIPPGMLLRYKSVSGSVIGGIPVMNEMLEFAARHNIVAKTELFPLDSVNDALIKVRNNTARYRMVLEV